MWKIIINRIHAIESALVQNREYISKNDAINLVSVDINYNLLDTSSSGTSQKIVLKGCSKLVDDIASVLSDGYNLQQREVAGLRNSVDIFCGFIDKNASSLHLHGNMEFEAAQTEANLLGVDDLVPVFMTGWNDLPAADDEDQSSLISHSHSPHLRYLERKRKLFSLREKLCRRAENLFRSLQCILDVKVVCYTTIKSTFDTYSHFIVTEAHNVGVSNALHRVVITTKSDFAKLLTHQFLDPSEINALIERLKKAWSNLSNNDNLTFNDRSLSIKYSYSDQLTHDWLGHVKLGAGAILVLWAFSECFNNERLGHFVWNDPTFAIFMCLGNTLLLLWLWGLSVHVWKSHDIDFIKLLDLHGTELDNISFPERSIYSSASNMTLIYLVVFIFFNKTIRGVVNLEGSIVVAHCLTLAMTGYFLYRALTPWHSRKKWFYMLWTVLSSPFQVVSFRDSYVGDILTSLPRVLISICSAATYVFVIIASLVLTMKIDLNVSSVSSAWLKSSFLKKVVVPFFSLAPLWIRLMQCLRRSIETGNRWPHMANALKYSIALIVISFGVFRPNMTKSYWWMASFFVATLYQYIWDLTMDWGLIVWESSKYATPTLTFGGLSIRKTRIYGSLALYTSLMIVNLFLRFAWTLTLLPSTIAAERSLGEAVLFHLGPIIAAVEVFRRMVWGFCRLEYEQLEVIGVVENVVEKVEEFSILHVQVDEKIENKTLTTYFNLDWTSSAAGVLSSIHSINMLGLSTSSTLQQRGRFVESVIFAFLVLAIITYAAV